MNSKNFIEFTKLYADLLMKQSEVLALQSQLTALTGENLGELDSYKEKIASFFPFSVLSSKIYRGEIDYD